MNRRRFLSCLAIAPALPMVPEAEPIRVANWTPVLDASWFNDVNSIVWQGAGMVRTATLDVSRKKQIA
jgi:hypothetical protein